MLIDLPELGRGPSRCSRITRRARSRCSGRTTIARGPPVVSPSIAPDPRFVTRCMQGTPASRRMAHTKTASNSEATTSITARSLTPESIAERASRPSSGCPGRHVVSNTGNAGKRARRRHASEISKRGRTKDRTGSHALAARGSRGCDAVRLPWGSAMPLSAWVRRFSAKRVPVGRIVFVVKNDGRREHDFSFAGLVMPLLAPGGSAPLSLHAHHAGWLAPSKELCPLPGRLGHSGVAICCVSLG